MSDDTDTGSTEVDATAAAPSPVDDTAARTIPRWRRILVAVLVVVGCVLAPVSIIGVWLHNTLLETDQWVDTVGPLIDDPAVQVAVANRVSEAVVEGTDLQRRVRDLLPSRARPLAPAIAEGAEQAVDVAALKIVESDQFDTLWNEVNRRAHKRVVAVLKGEGTETVQTKNGQIVLDLQPIIDEVRTELSDRGITLFDDVDTSAADRRIVIFSSDDLSSVQSIVRLFDALAIALPIITVLVFAAAIALSGNRRRTILRGSLGIALAVGLVLTVFNLGRTAYLDALPASVNQEAAQAVYDQILSFLRTSLRMSFALALVVALAAWLSGPSRIAVRTRATVGRGVERGSELGTAPSPVAGFAARYRTALRVLLAGLGLVVLMVLEHPGPWSVLVIAVLVVIGILVVDAVARAAAPEPPSTPEPAA